MQLLKVVHSDPAAAAALAQLQAARAGSGLGYGEAIAHAILDALDTDLQQHPAIARDVIAAVLKWVNSETRFVSQQTAPADAVAHFYEAEHERAQEFIGLVVDIMQEIMSFTPRDDAGAGVIVIDVPLVTLIRDAGSLVHNIVECILARHFEGGALHLGAGLAVDLAARLARASGMSLIEARQKHHRLKWPDQTDLVGSALVKAYLDGTPLGNLLLSLVPLRISDEMRMSHALALGGTGAGKSQLIGHLLRADLSRPHGQEVGIVVLDSTRKLFDKIVRLEHFAGNDRLLMVDIDDLDYLPSVNLFGLGAGLNRLGGRDREKAILSTVQVTEYVIGGLMGVGSELTTKQGVPFKYLIRLLLTVPDANLFTLLDVLESPQKYTEAMGALQGTARLFFEKEFMDRQFTSTRKEIARRCYDVLGNSVFERIFSSTENRLDITAALDAGRVVVVNTSRDMLGDECSVLGRYVIACVLKAGFDRSGRHISQCRPSFLYIDEASEYLDDRLSVLLEQVRKFNIGAAAFLQTGSQMDMETRGRVFASTAIKLAAGGAAKDARALASDMRTTEEFIKAQYKDAQAARWATYIRDVTPEAVSWRVPFGALEDLPQMSDAEFEAVLQRSRQELCAPTIRRTRPIQPQVDAEPIRVVPKAGKPAKSDKADVFKLWGERNRKR